MSRLNSHDKLTVLNCVKECMIKQIEVNCTQLRELELRHMNWMIYHHDPEFRRLMRQNHVFQRTIRAINMVIEPHRYVLKYSLEYVD